MKFSWSKVRTSPNIEGVSSFRVLGVILNDKLTATGHVDNLLSASTGLMKSNVNTK